MRSLAVCDAGLPANTAFAWSPYRFRQPSKRSPAPAGQPSISSGRYCQHLELALHSAGNPAKVSGGKSTILRFSRATTAEELFTGQWQSRTTKLDAYKPYLDQRWQEGCTSAWKLWEEIRKRGYPDGYGNVRNYVSRSLRGKPQPVGPRPPSARAVTRRLLTHPDALIESDRVQLKAVLANCPELEALGRRPVQVQHVRCRRIPARTAVW
ncbi:hypothetical protein [Streptomyces sp. NPDC126933]|uniref:hypothetical protein n=1 Tax=unclassified Streptomyces TaxID=2593676 RepID=UPI003669F8DB